MSAALLFAGLVCLSTPLVLDNGAVQVVVEPELFAITSIRAGSGTDFVEALPRSPDAVRSGAWMDPGGLVTDVLPVGEGDAALRRGPARVVEQRSNHLTLEGPVSRSTGLTLTKEITLAPPGEPTARFRVTVTSTLSATQRLYVRNAARVPIRSTLRMAKRDDTIRPLAGTDSIYPAVVKSRDYWLVPVPPTATMKGVVLGALMPDLREERAYVTWVRRPVPTPGTAIDYDHGSNVVCLLDSKTRTFGAVLQSALADVDASTPLVFEEEWHFEKRGRRN